MFCSTDDASVVTVVTENSSENTSMTMQSTISDLKTITKSNKDRRGNTILTIAKANLL